MEKRLSLLLMNQILETVKESGANKTEALCALQAAEAMLPDLDLQVKATVYSVGSAQI